MTVIVPSAVTNSLFHGYEESRRDPPVQCCKDCAVCLRKLRQMTVSSLFRGLHPAGEMCNVLIIRNKRKTDSSRRLKLIQQLARLPNCDAVLWHLCQHSDEAQLGNRAGCQIRSGVCGQSMYPSSHPLVKFMFEESERHEGIYIEQVSHGNSNRISWTCLLLNGGASTPALRTGRPVMRSTTSVAFEKRLFRGVNTTPPACTFASKESPGCKPSRRRIATASTI